MADCDAADWFRLGAEAFSPPQTPPPAAAPSEPSGPMPPVARPGVHPFGIVDGGELLARGAWREYDSWFGHEVVPTCGIASVTVALEARGRGLLAPLMRHLHQDARAHGAVIGTLFPTATGIYRRFGYELIGSYTQVELLTADLALLPESSASTRRARSQDIEAVIDLYDAWAGEQNGPLTRSGPSSPDSAKALAEELAEDRLACTLAVDAHGRAIGYALWKRSGGYGSGGICEVEDLVAVDLDGWTALLRTLGTNAPVAPRTLLWTSGWDVSRHVLPTNGWRIVDEHPYMLAVLDVVGALEARGWSTALEADLDFRVVGDRIGDLDGSYHVRVREGRAECSRMPGHPQRTYTPRGLALAYAGAQSSANLRFAGQLTGPDIDDATWDALLAGRSLHIRDEF